MPVPSGISDTYAILGNAALTDALMRNYDQTLYDIVQLQAGIYGMIPTKKDLQQSGLGDGWYFDLQIAHNERGVGTRQYGGTIPVSASTRHKQGYVLERALYADVKINNRSAERFKNRGSFTKDLAMHEVKDVGKVAAKELARMVYCDGSGVIGTMAGAGSSATTGYLSKAGGCRASGRLYIRRDTYVDSYDSIGGTIGMNSNRISDVVKGTTTDTITLADAATWDDGELLFREDVYATTADTDWEGMSICFDDGTDFSSYAGITVSGASYWKGIVDRSSTTRPWDPETLKKLLNEQYINNGVSVRDQKIISNIGQPDEYWKYMMPAFQVNVQKSGVKFDIGVSEAQPFFGIPWITDVNCPLGELFVPDFRHFFKWELKGFGAPVRGLGGKDWTWDNSNREDDAETYRAMYGNFLCNRRDTQIWMKDLAENFLS